MEIHLADYEKVYIKSNQNLETIDLIIVLYAEEMKKSCSRHEGFFNNL